MRSQVRGQGDGERGSYGGNNRDNDNNGGHLQQLGEEINTSRQHICSSS